MTANGKLDWANVTRKLAELKPWADNPRFSTKAQAQRLLDSWKALGQFQTIAIGPAEEDTALYPVYDGHQRLSALLTLYGPEYAIDARQASRPLTDAEHRQLVIAANLAAGQWDWQKLAAWDTAELSEWGFGAEQLRVWNNDANNLKEMLLADADAETADAEPQSNRAEELREKWGVKLGDLWRVGEHRLLCGDSTQREDVERVMRREKAALFATDPPYGVDYIAVKAGIPDSGYASLDLDYTDIIADNLKNEAMKEWLEGVFNIWHEFLNPDCAWYLWHPMLLQGYFAAAAAAAAAAAVIIHRQIIWVKSGFNLTRSGMYHWAHELCFYGWSKGHVPPWYGEKNQRSVWEIDRHDGKGLHPTEKPPELWYAPMRNHVLPGQVCAEPFAGSGSQFVAGENLGRRVFGIEIEPKYVAIILQRMADAFPSIEIERLE